MCFISPLPLCHSLCACPCMYTHVEARDWYRMFSLVVVNLVIWDRVSHWTWSWPIWLHHQASKFQGPSCPCQPRDYNTCCPQQAFNVGAEGLRRWACHCSKASVFLLSSPPGPPLCHSGEAKMVTLHLGLLSVVLRVYCLWHLMWH